MSPIVVGHFGYWKVVQNDIKEFIVECDVYQGHKGVATVVTTPAHTRLGVDRDVHGFFGPYKIIQKVELIAYQPAIPSEAKITSYFSCILFKEDTHGGEGRSHGNIAHHQ